MIYPGDLTVLRNVCLQDTTGSDSEARRRCCECMVDCSDLHVSLSIGGQHFYYCMPDALAYFRAYAVAV